MRQEINLYTNEFVPKIKWCSFLHAVIVVILFVVILAFHSFHQYQQLLSLKKENAVLMENSEGLEQEPSQTKNLMDKIVEKRNLLEKQISALSSEVESKKLIKGAYEAEKNMTLASSYDIFLTIAKQSLPNLSVDEVALYDGGEKVLVNGYSRTREDIPAYFQRLKKEASFRFSDFGLLKIEKEANLGLYQFTMQRQDEATKQGEEVIFNKAILSNEVEYDG